jgi:hypothetical protein
MWDSYYMKMPKKNGSKYDRHDIEQCAMCIVKSEKIRSDPALYKKVMDFLGDYIEEGKVEIESIADIRKKKANAFNRKEDGEAKMKKEAQYPDELDGN